MGEFGGENQLEYTKFLTWFNMSDVKEMLWVLFEISNPKFQKQVQEARRKNQDTKQ